MIEELTHDPKDELRATKAFIEIDNLEVKDVPTRWTLLTYDLPHTEEGDRARVEFLRTARKIGAVSHTESVYLCPWTLDFNDAVTDLALHGGRAFVWQAETDKDTAEQLAVLYDQKVLSWIEDIMERIDKIRDHHLNGKDWLAEKMMPATVEMIQDMKKIASKRRSRILDNGIQDVDKELIRCLAEMG